MSDISKGPPNWLIWIWIVIGTGTVTGVLGGIVAAIWRAAMDIGATP